MADSATLVPVNDFRMKQLPLSSPTSACWPLGTNRSFFLFFFQCWCKCSPRVPACKRSGATSQTAAGLPPPEEYLSRQPLVSVASYRRAAKLPASLCQASQVERAASIGIAFDSAAAFWFVAGITGGPTCCFSMKSILV